MQPNFRRRLGFRTFFIFGHEMLKLIHNPKERGSVALATRKSGGQDLIDQSVPSKCWSPQGLCLLRN